MEDSIKKLFDVDPKKIPSSIPLFPLENVLLLPFGKLPLNIFEPRYISMVEDALGKNRMIGMIQPNPGSQKDNGLYPIGCASKIISFSSDKIPTIDIHFTLVFCFYNYKTNH